MFVEETWDVLLANYGPIVEIRDEGTDCEPFSFCTTLRLEEKGRSRPDNRVCMHENLSFRNRCGGSRDK